MKKNNGFTLAEVMIIVAIMGVLASIVGISMGVVFGQRVKSIAADTKALFQSTQTVAFGRDDAYIELTQSNGVVHITAYSSTNNVINEVEGRNVQMTIYFSDNTSSASAEIHFNRQTGGLAATNGKYVSRIVFENGTKTVTLNVSRLTGKVTY